jgi:hypothetical protein
MDKRTDTMDLQLTAEEIGRHQAAPLKRKAKAKAKPPAKFYKLPPVWVGRLKGASGATYDLALFLLERTWLRGWQGEPVSLPKPPEDVTGLTRATRNRSLRDLEKRGIVELQPSAKYPAYTVKIKIT